MTHHSVVNSPNPAKQKQVQDINQHCAEFFANGGAVQEIPAGEQLSRIDYAPHDFVITTQGEKDRRQEWKEGNAN